MNVQFFLIHQPVEFDVIPHRGAYDASHLAQALHVPGKNIAKTVLLRVDDGDRYIIAVLPADRRIDLDRLSHFLWGSKLELASEAEVASHCTDCEVGVFPPFGSQFGLTTVMDRSLVETDEIVFEGNNHREAIRMKTEDFQIIEQPLICSFSS